MTPEEIAALAREYAEWVTDVPKAKELPNCLLNEANKLISDGAERMLTWLLRRYALVEKEAVRKQFEDAKRLLETCNYNKKCIGVGSRGVLERLFPEIGKEVES